MNSQKNVLQVLVSAFDAPTNQIDLASLNDGEIGFFDNAGDAQVSGYGRFVLRKGTEYIQSPYFTLPSDYTALIQSYAAPVMRQETLTLSAAVVVGTYYQLRIEMDIKGMTGKYIKEAYYKAVTGDTVNSIALALANQMTAALAREGNTALTVTATGLSGIITITQVEQTYVAGKKLGWAVPFTSGITAGPEADIQTGTVVAGGNHGTGTGKYVHAKEYFAWGNQDAYRWNGWRNNFTPKVYADETHDYDVLAVNELVYENSDNADVPVYLQLLLAFDQATPVAV